MDTIPLTEFQPYMGQQNQTPLALQPTQVEGDSIPVHDPPQWLVQGQTFHLNDISLADPQPYMGQPEQTFPAPHLTQVEGDNIPVHDPPQWLVQGQTFQLYDIQLPELQPYMGQQEQTFPAPHLTQVEEDNTPMHSPPQLPTNTPPPACPICGRTFTRTQERNRHLRSYLPHFIYCPFSGCAWRCDRHDNLRNHWQRKHANHGQAPQKQECEIYNPDSFVKLVTCGQMSIEEAANAALFEVIRRASEEGKQDLWSENWSGRRSQHRAAA